MVLKVYISGMSGNKEVKKRQQRVLMILDSKNIQYEVIDITEPGRESDKEFMQNKSTSNGATVSDPDPRHALPPQLFNEENYCGDYDAFDLANEIDTLEQFLKVASADITAVSNAQIELKQENGEAKHEANGNGGENKENECTEPNKDDENSEKPENNEQVDAPTDKGDSESEHHDKEEQSSSSVNENNNEPLDGSITPINLTSVNDSERTITVTNDLVKAAAVDIVEGEGEKATALGSISPGDEANIHLMEKNKIPIHSNEKANDQKVETNLEEIKINNEKSSIQDTMQTMNKEYENPYEPDHNSVSNDCQISQPDLKVNDEIKVAQSDLNVDERTECDDDDDDAKLIHNQQNLITLQSNQASETEKFETSFKNTIETGDEEQENEAQIQDSKSS